MTDSPPMPEMSSEPSSDALVPATLRPFYAALTPPQRRAALLVLILNAAADPSFKSRYARRWWGIVEERVKLAAMMRSSLAAWSSAVAQRLGGDLARNAEHRAAWLALVQPGDDHAVLRALQEETPVLIAFVRAVSEAKRERFEAKVAAEATLARDEPLTPAELALF